MKSYQKLCKRTRGHFRRGEYKQMKRRAERREAKRLLREKPDEQGTRERRVYFGWDD